MKRETYRIALGGLMTAAAVSVLFLGSILPFATFIAPALASLCVLYFQLEYGRGMAAVVYAAVGILAALLAPDKEQALLFICFIGYYPIVKGLFERLRSRALALLLKIALCDLSMAALYYVLTKVLVVEAVREEFEAYTTTVLVSLLVLGTVTFVLFDAALTRLSVYYEVKLRPKLKKAR